MTGRKRRGSTSSVETVPESEIHWLKESSVVRSVPKDLPSDSWPSFELRDAVVYDKEGKVLENALNVGAQGPYIVRGLLIIDDPSQKSHLIKRVRSSVPIEIQHSIKYSIGESDGGRPVIWVSGRGGWYEISPSAKYRPVYNKMCEATTLYYSIMDTYNSKKFKKLLSKVDMASISQAFLEYVTRVGDGSTLEEVIERCEEHATFFICQFAQENGASIDWTRTGFYKWFMREHADLAAKIASVLKNPPPYPRTPSVEIIGSATRGKSSGAATRSTSVEQPDAGPVLPPQQSKSQNLTSRVHQVSTIIVPKSSPVTLVAAGDTSPDGGAAYQSVLRAFLDVIQQSAAANNKSKLTTTNVFNGLYRDYRFPNYQDGTPGCHKIPPAEVLHYNAPALLQALDKATYEKYEIYNWLQEMVNTEFHPVVFKPQDFPIHIVARQKKSAAVKPPIIIEDNIFEDDEDDVMSDTPRRGGKGVKQAGRRGGKTSGLRTVTSKKRPLVAPESESESEPETGDFKRSHYFSEGEEDTAMDDASKATTQSHSEAPDTPQPTGDQIKVFIRAEKMPSTVPKGPDNTWTCDQEGCDHIVRGGDEDQVQARILEHFNYHEQQAKRLSLALSESRGQLPINHLLDKLKKMGEKVGRSQQLVVGGAVLPEPIKRKLIV